MAKKVMVVDDEPDTLELTKTVLEMEGLEVTTFDASGDALDSLKKGKIPDLVLLDMRMPVISGPGFCEKVRADPKTKGLKILFFTASSARDDATVKKYGVLGYIFKPFDNDQLVRDVKKFLGS